MFTGAEQATSITVKMNHGDMDQALAQVSTMNRDQLRFSFFVLLVTGNRRGGSTNGANPERGRPRGGNGDHSTG